MSGLTSAQKFEKSTQVSSPNFSPISQSLLPTYLAPGQPRPGSLFYSLRVDSPTMAHTVDDKLTPLGLQPSTHPCFCYACHSFALLLFFPPPSTFIPCMGHPSPTHLHCSTHGLQLQAQLPFSPSFTLILTFIPETEPSWALL